MEHSQQETLQRRENVVFVKRTITKHRNYIKTMIKEDLLKKLKKEKRF
jgi:hypothetical protein